MVMEIVFSLIILFVGIAILVSIHFCIVGRAFGTNHISGGDIQRSSRSTSVKGVSSGDLNKLPCFDYEEKEKGSSSNHVDCAVCLESFKVGEACRLLPNCGHSFHVQCIDLWILKTPCCPICRTWVHSNVMVMREDSSVPHGVEIEMP